MDHHHQHQLLHGLNHMRRSAILTDITLCLGDKTYHVHKVVLSACSDYFRAMFTSDNMVEATTDKIKLCGIPVEGLEFLLDYMYTAKLGLTLTNVQSVLSASTHCQVMPVIKACAMYLQGQMDVENCIDIATIAENYALTDLRDAVYSFICENFGSVSETSDYCRLTPEQLIHMLSGNNQFDCLEIDVLKLVLEWFFRSKHENAASFASTIFNHIHFPKIVLQELQIMLHKFFLVRKLDKENHYLYQAIMAIATQPSSALNVDLYFDTFNTRGMEEVLVKIGGFGNAGLSNGLTYCPVPMLEPRLTKREWTNLTTIPHVDQCHYGVATLSNHLYIVGGCFNQHLQEVSRKVWVGSIGNIAATFMREYVPKGKVIHQFGFRYSGAKDSWFRIAPMRVERCRFVLAEIGGKLYACGGAIDAEVGEGTKTCECYNPENDCWSSISPMPEYRTQHAGVSFTNWDSTRLIFISGGIYKDVVSDTLYAYNVSMDSWKECRPMIAPRADHFLLSFRDKLYACGGWRDDPDGQGSTIRAQVDTIDSYDVTTDTWQEIARVGRPRYHSAIVAVRERIYFIGGFYEDVLFYKKIAPVEYYDVLTNSWTIDRINSQDFWELSSVSMFVPMRKRAISEKKQTTKRSA